MTRLSRMATHGPYRRTPGFVGHAGRMSLGVGAASQFNKELVQWVADTRRPYPAKTRGEDYVGTDATTTGG